MLRAFERLDDEILQRFLQVRATSIRLIEQLSDADATVQSMPDASPAKWHLAHATWFFESFVLLEFASSYRCFNPDFARLFNSYYESKGARIARQARGILTRPSLQEVLDYRGHIDEAVVGAFDHLPPEARELVELGCHHEEQHQELLLTDLLHLFSEHPLEPIYRARPDRCSETAPEPLRWIEGALGAVQIGHDGSGFSFDCEGPRHFTWLSAHALADRLVTNAEWLEFIDDGGYRRPELWLSDGWVWIRDNNVGTPLHWRPGASGEWGQFGLDGPRQLEMHAPVSHVSYYEAEAFARWAGARLPTEAEWESAANAPSTVVPPGSFAALRPRPAEGGGRIRQLYDEVWQWTGSTFLPYPGFRPGAGAVGEYNGKFMCNQFVLRGSSCITPRGHTRRTYRNFFHPYQRWQFTGVRLAKDL